MCVYVLDTFNYATILEQKTRLGWQVCFKTLSVAPCHGGGGGL
jgi:hypothetical protein